MTPLKARVGAANAQALLDNPAVTGDTWTLAQLIGAFTPSTGSAPSITSLNGHASHYQFQPPNADNGARAPLYTTTNFTGSTASQTNRLVFSMGCHAGLSVADSIVTSGASTLDWPQAFTQKGRRRLPRQHGLRLRRQPRRRVLRRAEPALRAAHRRGLLGRRRARRRRSRRTTGSSASSASTTRRRWRSSPSTACRCGESRDREMSFAPRSHSWHPPRPSRRSRRTLRSHRSRSR